MLFDHAEIGTRQKQPILCVQKYENWLYSAENSTETLASQATLYELTGKIIVSYCSASGDHECHCGVTISHKWACLLHLKIIGRGC